jgi:hypothetical protein
MVGGFAASALWLGATGLSTHLTYGRYVSRGCIAPVATSGCSRLLDQISDITWTVSLLPWIMAVFIAVPLATSTFETGAYRFAMTQGVSWRTQVTVKLLLFAVLAAAGSCLLSILAGTMIRRAVPAMAATVVAVLAVTALTTGFGVTDHGGQSYGPLGAALLRIDTTTRRGQLARRPRHQLPHRLSAGQAFLADSGLPRCDHARTRPARGLGYCPAVWVGVEVVGWLGTSGSWAAPLKARRCATGRSARRGRRCSARTGILRSRCTRRPWRTTRRAWSARTGAASGT